jgi:hypothetical protein
MGVFSLLSPPCHLFGSEAGGKDKIPKQKKGEGSKCRREKSVNGHRHNSHSQPSIGATGIIAGSLLLQPTALIHRCGCRVGHHQDLGLGLGLLSPVAPQTERGPFLNNNMYDLLANYGAELRQQEILIAQEEDELSSTALEHTY